MKGLLAVALLAGCEQNLLADLHDAAIDAHAADASIDAFVLTGCPQPTMPLAPGVNKLYLNTEGQVLTSDGACNDAATNCTDLLKTSPTIVPPFLHGDDNRTTFIAQLAAAVQQALAPYSVDVVTTRPSIPVYQMMVLGGDPSLISAAAGTYSVTPFACKTFERTAIDLVFQDEPLAVDSYANLILDDFGIMVGLPASMQADDCLCRIDVACNTSTTSLCTFGSHVPTTDQMLPNGMPFNCGITPTEDEPALLAAALGCR